LTRDYKEEAQIDTRELLAEFEENKIKEDK